MSANHPKTDIVIACENCLFLSLRQPNGAGQCFRYPPTVVVMVGQRKDIVSAQVQAVQQAIAIRPTMQATEFCGEFAPAQRIEKPQAVVAN